MGGEKWPAFAIQGTFLAANISFFLSGKQNIYIIASMTVIAALFAIQSISSNARFTYLFPVRLINFPSKFTVFPHQSSTVSVDTYILRFLIVLSIFLFYWGATLEIEKRNLVYAGLIGLGVISILFPITWDKWLEKPHRSSIAKRLEKRSPIKAIHPCPNCGGPAEFSYETRKSQSVYWETIKYTCHSNCHGKGTLIIKDAQFI